MPQMQKASEMKQKHKWQWFVEPLDAFSNQFLASMLDAGAYLQMKDGGHRPHNVWDCSPIDACKLRLSAKEAGLCIAIYVRYNDGPLERCDNARAQMLKFLDSLPGR